MAAAADAVVVLHIPETDLEMQDQIGGGSCGVVRRGRLRVADGRILSVCCKVTVPCACACNCACASACACACACICAVYR
jgi:hypothetical protein